MSSCPSTRAPLAPPLPFAPTVVPGGHGLNSVPNTEDADCVPWEWSPRPSALQYAEVQLTHGQPSSLLQVPSGNYQYVPKPKPVQPELLLLLRCLL